MRFLSIDLPPVPDVNLGPIQMDGLGATVVLAGRNGAGKTRLLSQLIKWVNRFDQLPQFHRQITASCIMQSIEDFDVKEMCKVTAMDDQEATGRTPVQPELKVNGRMPVPL